MARWPDIVHYFNPLTDTALRDPQGVKMNTNLMTWLDAFRMALGQPFTVTSGFRPSGANMAAGGASDSAHLDGEAVDGYAEGVRLTTMAAIALTYPFSGVGLYPHTTPATIHLDVRDRGHSVWPHRRTALWIRLADGQYVYAPTTEFRMAWRQLVWGEGRS